MKLLVFGSLNIDHTYQLPHLVREGETLSSSTYARNEGGKGFNQAAALAKAGQKVHFAGAIGQDGLFLKEYLANLGINVSCIPVLSAPTGHAIIQINAQGSNSIILYGGANQAITEAQIDQVLAQFEQPGRANPPQGPSKGHACYPESVAHFSGTADLAL